jgi:transcription antitermination factor NusA-like protein
MSPGTYAIIGILLTFSIFLSNVIYRAGQLSSRVDELERWRIDIRKDMHEISDQLEKANNTLKYLTTLIEERTEKRTFPREH